MCCFTGSFDVSVSATRIFAREVSSGVQALAYGMTLSSPEATAMVLPLPVRVGAGEDAVRFVSLERHPQMFEELDELFRLPENELLLSSSARRGGAPDPPPLVVHEVGSFIASYVPTRAGFGRLDPRFRIADALFDAVPHYADYGFAVFQLRAGTHRIHPMALTFPTRDPRRLFFPTVHVHDGQLHARAKFDHDLYFQRRTGPRQELGDEQRPEPTDAAYEEWRSYELTMSTLNHVSRLPAASSYEGLTAPGQPVVRRSLHGSLLNRDTWVDAAPSAPTQADPNEADPDEEFPFRLLS
ncbi:MAG TPA: hypothetical protein VNO30_42785 [Kofleriaceae bacterium]|nr:hypothetical protein [Kofleriaceae bacterium]